MPGNMGITDIWMCLLYIYKIQRDITGSNADDDWTYDIFAAF